MLFALPVTASESATRRKEKDSTGSSLGLKNSSTDALNVCLNRPNPGTSRFALLRKKEERKKEEGRKTVSERRKEGGEHSLT